MTTLPLPITLAELESHLWEAANILRGSPVDRTDWTSYILFFKRICNVWDEEHEAMLAEYGEDFADEHRFQILDCCHWRDVRRIHQAVVLMRTCFAIRFAMIHGASGTAYWTSFGPNLIEHERTKRSRRLHANGVRIVPGG